MKEIPESVFLLCRGPVHVLCSFLLCVFIFSASLWIYEHGAVNLLVQLLAVTQPSLSVSFPGFWASFIISRYTDDLCFLLILFHRFVFHILFFNTVESIFPSEVRNVSIFFPKWGPGVLPPSVGECVALRGLQRHFSPTGPPPVCTVVAFPLGLLSPETEQRREREPGGGVRATLQMWGPAGNRYSVSAEEPEALRAQALAFRLVE